MNQHTDSKRSAKQFTPGEWELFTMYGGWSLKSGGHRIAAIVGTRKANDDPGEAQANARLIRAGKEMYELLECLADRARGKTYALSIGQSEWIKLTHEARRIKAEIDGEG